MSKIRMALSEKRRSGAASRFNGLPRIGEPEHNGYFPFFTCMVSTVLVASSSCR